MKRLTIARRVLLGFATVLLLTALLGAFAYVRITVIEKQSADITHNVAGAKVDQVTQANAASAEDCASAAAELSTQAKFLDGAVAKLLLLTRTTRDTPPPTDGGDGGACRIGRGRKPESLQPRWPIPIFGLAGAAPTSALS